MVQICKDTFHIGKHGGGLVRFDADTIILEIETRAKRANITIAELCRRANIAKSTFLRWKNGDCSPTISTLQNIITELDAEEAKQAITL